MGYRCAGIQCLGAVAKGLPLDDGGFRLSQTIIKAGGLDDATRHTLGVSES